MPKDEIRVAELFAGVGGFRLGLEGYKGGKLHPELDRKPAGPFRTVWANQWEPPGGERKQFAARCYATRWNDGTLVNEDIHEVLSEYADGKRDIPDFDMLVGGFPCQSYSVAQVKSRSRGIEGDKGVLWWDIYNMLILKEPRYVLLENVDRLLLSPSSQKGRDFAIILSCLAKQGYSAEWRVINAADYGFVQKRRRVYIYAVKTDKTWDLAGRLERDGVMARTFPITSEYSDMHMVRIGDDIAEVSDNFGEGSRKSVFGNAGVMQDGVVFTAKTRPSYKGDRKVLADVLSPESEIPESYYVDDEDQLAVWRYQRVSKKLERTTADGHTWFYSEGAMAFPDPVDRPARTILTGGGGAAPSRMKHIIEPVPGRFRRLVPDELDRIQDFPKGWTDTGMTDSQRAFCAGNALVVGIPHLLGKTISKLRE